MSLIFDLECNDFLQGVTTVWCGVFKDTETGEETKLENPDSVDGNPAMGTWIQELFDDTDGLIGHNIIAYDLEVLRKLFGIEWKGRVFDTMVISYLLNPDRDGGHSLEAWGKRLGIHKEEWDDFSKFDPDMVDYCHQDVIVNEALYNYFREGLKGWDGIELLS